MRIEARYSLRWSLFLLVLGLASLGIVAIPLFRGMADKTFLFAGTLLVLIGARGLDRRVMLRVGSEGLWFGPWGGRPIPWSEFESFSVFQWRGVYHLQVNP